ncbi:dynein light chain, cytosolic, partial [Aureobasidium melanogenum]
MHFSSYTEKLGRVREQCSAAIIKGHHHTDIAYHCSSRIPLLQSHITSLAITVKMSTCPVTETRLSQIAADACNNAFSSATTYNHAQTEQWNSEIIKSILTALISESKGEVQYKFAVNSTIIQHLTDPRPAGSDASATPSTATVGRRGMHSATGAYWNTEKDGIWNYKYEGGEAKGMDVVVCVMWVAN